MYSQTNQFLHPTRDTQADSDQGKSRHIHRKMKLNVFTNITLFSTFLSWILNSEFILCISYCWIWGVMISFTAARFVDHTVYERMMEKNKMSSFVFHSGNLVLHFLPVVATLFPPFPHITFYHSTIASGLFYYWCFWASRGTLDLSTIYVYMPNDVWKKSIYGTICVFFCVPWLFHFISSSTSNAFALPSSSR
jgi:hypothetical protein